MHKKYIYFAVLDSSVPSSVKYWVMRHIIATSNKQYFSELLLNKPNFANNYDKPISWVVTRLVRSSK